MKKNEAEELAIKRVDVIFEYITQILNDNLALSANMNFSHAKIDGNNMCTLDIFVPYNKFERHINLGITNDHSNVIKKEFLNRVITDILPSDSLGATKFYSFRSNTNIFDGINIMNSIGNEIKVNMYGIDQKISTEYNMKYNSFVDTIQEKCRPKL